MQLWASKKIDKVFVNKMEMLEYIYPRHNKLNKLVGELDSL